METDIAASLDEQLITIQPWCTCKEPYWCEGKELNELCSMSIG